MNKIFFLSIISFAFVLISCDDDEGGNDQNTVDYHYHAHIHSPNTDDKHVGDTIHIHVNFESHAGEPVHHINVRIYNQMDSTIIYNEPADAHIHETDGMFEFHDDFVLSEANGVSEHSNWVFEAKVWGENAGDGEVIEILPGNGFFHVHP